MMNRQWNDGASNLSSGGGGMPRQGGYNGSGGGNEPWRNRERHYCEVCNVWMGSDRQSILLHENGKKHKENVQKAMQKQRQDRLDQEKQTKKVQSSLQAMEVAALQSHVQDIGLFPLQQQQQQHDSNQCMVVVPMQPQPMVNSSGVSASDLGSSRNQPLNQETVSKKRQLKQEKQVWESRKKKRSEEQSQDRDLDETTTSASLQRTATIGENEGFYTLGNVKIKSSGDSNVQQNQTTTTYLEGVVFGDLLEEDMPIQIWSGSNAANEVEQRLVQYHHLWLDGIVAAVRKRHNNSNTSSFLAPDRLLVDVAYLRQLNDEDETLEKSVPLHRIRIVLGADEKIPSTLEEARIMAMGGEEIVNVANMKKKPSDEEGNNNNNDDDKATSELQESTGFSTWSTVSVKRTTVQQELREEREQLRKARKEAAIAAEKEAKKASLRRLEEAKTMNADDSALGAYDVWSRGTKEGYKGVHIHHEAKLEVHELGKKLATNGVNVGFKKPMFANKKKKQNRRTTSVDD